MVMGTLCKTVKGKHSFFANDCVMFFVCLNFFGIEVVQKELIHSLFWLGHVF